MSTPHRRPLGTGPALPEPAPRDPRTLTAAERAATDTTWVEHPTPPAATPRTGRRPLGTGTADPGH